MNTTAVNPLNLEPRLQAILQQDYPRFSDTEYARRHRALAAAMEKHGCDHLLVVTDHRTGNAVQWATGWPGTVEAYVIFKPAEQMLMHMECTTTSRWDGKSPGMSMCAGENIRASPKPLPS